MKAEPDKENRKPEYPLVMLLMKSITQRMPSHFKTRPSQTSAGLNPKSQPSAAPQTILF